MSTMLTMSQVHPEVQPGDQPEVQLRGNESITNINVSAPPAKIDNLDTSGSNPEVITSNITGKPSFEFRNDDIKFLDPTFSSFDTMQNRDNEHSEWIKPPDYPHDLFTLINEGKEAMEKKGLHGEEPLQNWLLSPNAETESELLRHANSLKARDARHAESLFMNNNVVGTRVKPGSVLFCTNRNNQIVYGQGAHNFYGTLTTADDNGLIDLNEKKNSLIKRKNIIILSLEPDQIAIALQDRKPVVLLPGRHCYNNPNFILQSSDIITVGQKPITRRNLSVTIAMVLPGYLGFGYLKAKPVVLQPGLHISRLPSFQYHSNLDMRTLISSDSRSNDLKGVHVNHDNIHLVRVNQNQYSLALIGGEPVFLLPGLHMYNDASFEFKSICHQFDELIHHENLWILQVQPNKIGLAWEGDNPVLISPGTWTKNNPLFKFMRFAHTSDEVITHGPITRYQVKHGEIGFAWRYGNVEELPAGINTVVDPNFKFAQTFPLNDQVIHFGNIARITTPEGFVRPVYLDGKLNILSSGFEKFTEPNIVIHDCFPVGEIISDMEEIEVLTRDRTPMLITGQVTYQISSPKNLILTLGYDKLGEALERTVDAILRHAFSITDLSTISPDPRVKNQGNSGMGFFRDEENSSEGKTFQGELCHEVHKELDKNTFSWGITIRDVAISSIHFKDRNVAHKLASATSNTRTAEAEFDLTQAKNKIQLELAQAEADLKLLQSRNEQQIKKIQVETKSQLELISNKASVDATAMAQDQEIKTNSFEIESKADAEATKILIIAEAERDAAILEAEGLKALANAKIANYSNPSLLQLEMMKLYVEGMGHLSQVATPAVILRSSGEEKSEDGSNVSSGQLMNVFRHQGRSLLSAGMKRKEFSGGRGEGGDLHNM